MGVKLNSLIETEKLPFSILKGKRVAIDGMNMLFQILYNPIQAKNKQLPYGFYLDSTQRVITHLYGWLQKVNHLYRNSIFPVIVFDGKPDVYKRILTKNYARDFLRVQELYKEALKNGDRENARNFALGKSYMFMNCVQESKNLLQMCGIPVIMAPSEAEAQCVNLQKQGLVDYVISNDYDVLLFGATDVIRKLTFQTRKQIKGKWHTIKPELCLISCPKNLLRLNISRSQLIDLSILLGNDYFKGIRTIGPKKALSSILYYKSIENMKFKHPNVFVKLPKFKIDRIRELFFYPEVINFTLKDLKIRPFNKLGLEDLLLKDHTLNSERIKKKLSTLTKLYQKFAKIQDSNPNKLIYEKDKLQFSSAIQRHLNRA
ncbi:MAG: hypothetical protein ACTSWL_08475, partial [Promethearchaeota archaeon]